MFQLNGKTAVVTGGGRGLGKGIALGLAKYGANVIVISRTESELKETTEELRKYSEHSNYKIMDLLNYPLFEKALVDIAETYGSIDILVNAAGINKRGSLLETTEDDWDLVMNVNLKSVFMLSKLVVPYMQKQKSGKIINIASLSSEIGLENMVSYCASKGGISQLTKAMAVEYAEENILVNAIGPGYYRTELTKAVLEDKQRSEWLLSRIPMKRLGEPEDIQGAAVFLASDASNYVTGQTIYVDGGWLSS